MESSSLSSGMYSREVSAAAKRRINVRAPTITRPFSVSDCDFSCFSECSGSNVDQAELLSVLP